MVWLRIQFRISTTILIEKCVQQSGTKNNIKSLKKLVKYSSANVND